MVKKLFFYVCLVFFVLGSVELISYVFFTHYQERYTFVDFSDYLLEEESLEKLQKIYHPQLGWKEPYETPYRERPRPEEYGRPLIAAYGDSYTHCDEVADDETWQFYLAERLQADVYNFGVGGYGAGQALLRFRLEHDKLNTPIVTLGLITENINRIVNVYRPFYYSVTRLRLTKPRYRLLDQGLGLLQNPVTRLEELDKLRSAEFLHQIGQNDWWYNRDEYPFLGFPYSHILFNKRLWLEAWQGKMERPVGDNDPRPWEKLWLDREARALTLAILDAFVTDVKGSGAQPVILMLPLQSDVIQKLSTGEDPTGLAVVKAHCREQGYACFDAIGALSRHAGNFKGVGELYHGGHVSAAGNRVIAGALNDYLRESGLLREDSVAKALAFSAADAELKLPDVSNVR